MLKVPLQSVNAAARRPAGLSHIRFVGVTLGSSDISIQTLHGSFEGLYGFVSVGILEIVPDVQSTETLQVAEVI